MHKSKLAGFIVDCQSGDLAAAAEFWGGALGMEVQKVAHPSRVHLDIETDDIAAEVARLERLGARRVQQVHTWWVMEAPTGHRFCVVSAEGSADFASRAKSWT